MKMHSRAVGATFGVALTAMALAQSNTVRMQESGLRRQATQTPLPAYPAASIADGRSGVAVAAVTTDESGRIASVEILEAPDAAIADAVRAALGRWVVPPTTIAGRSERLGIRSKLTFYFRIVKGQGRVFHPEQMPGGPKPEPAGGPPPMGPGARAVGGAAPAVVSHTEAPDLEIGPVEFEALLKSARPTVLDVRTREDFARAHHAAAVNIPSDELPIRAYVELDRTRPVVIDCAQADTRTCHAAARTLLRGVGLAKVLIFLP